jgi:hypothetical protein
MAVIVNEPIVPMISGLMSTAPEVGCLPVAAGTFGTSLAFDAHVVVEVVVTLEAEDDFDIEVERGVLELEVAREVEVLVMAEVEGGSGVEDEVVTLG